METAAFDRLYSSTNSSFPPFGPVGRNSLMTTFAGGVDVFVAVKVFVTIAVFVGVSVMVLVFVAVAVSVGVLDEVAVGGTPPHKLIGDDEF